MGCWDTFTLLLTHPSGMVRSTVLSGFLFLLLSTSISVGKCLSNFISKMRKIYLLANFWWIKYEYTAWASQIALVVKNLPANTGDVRDPGSIPGSGRSLREGHGNPLWYSSLENPMDGGAWRTAVHRITKSWTWLKQLGTQTLANRKHTVCSRYSINCSCSYIIMIIPAA